MKYELTATRNKQLLEDETEVRFLTSADRFYNTQGWVEEVQTFTYDGYLEMTNGGIYVDGLRVAEYRQNGEWLVQGETIPFNSVWIAPVMS
jgi:hypothetical protein